MSIIYRIKRNLETKYDGNKYNQSEYVWASNTVCRLELSIGHKYLSLEFFCEKFFCVVVKIIRFNCSTAILLQYYNFSKIFNYLFNKCSIQIKFIIMFERFLFLDPAAPNVFT